MAAPKFAQEGVARVLSSLESEQLRTAQDLRAERMSEESTTELTDMSSQERPAERQALMGGESAPSYLAVTS